MPDHNGGDDCTSVGDDFYVDALVRIARGWKPYW
jgi:hypothetical protein